jgi:hypothetical protein
MNKSFKNLQEVLDSLAKISNLQKEMVKYFDDSDIQQKLLKHLAASAVHLAMFSRDFYAFMTHEDFLLKRDQDRELLSEMCGCDFNKKEN